MIHFSEYFPTVLNKETLDFYQLNIKSNGKTKYKPFVDPTTINSVGAAAFRFGHSQVKSQFQVIKRPIYESYGFKLRFKEMSDIWEGNVCPKLYKIILIIILVFILFLTKIQFYRPMVLSKV